MVIMEIKNKEKTYHLVFHTSFSCQYHVVFCTKFRRKVLEGKIAGRLKEIILEKQEKFGYKILEMDIKSDFVHLLLELTKPEPGIYKTIGRIKRSTSPILREEFPRLQTRLPALWSRSRFFSTVGSISLEEISKYIEDQRGK